MPRFNPLRAPLLPLILAALLIATGLTGCSKQRASMALDKAKKNLALAKDTHEAAKFMPKELESTTAKVNETQQGLDGGQYDAALANSKLAVTMAQDLLDKTKQLRAAAMMTEAGKNIKAIETNQADTINKTLFDKIHQTFDQANQAKDKLKYEKVIELCSQIRTDTDALLSPLKTELDGKMVEAKAKLEELVREQGRQEAARFVTDTESKIAELDKLITYEQREYLKGRQVHTAILKLVSDGITEARKNRSVKKIQVLEEKLVKARFEGAEQYHADFLASCDGEYSAINKNFQSGNYVFVLQKADILDPRLDRLILETRILCAKDKMQNVSNAIAALDADKVRNYLPGRVEKMDKMLADAKAEFDKDLFDDVKKICAAAMEEKELVLKDFDALAVEEIRKGRADLESSSVLMSKMQSIFNIHSPVSQDPDRTNFENGKVAMKSELDQIVKDSDLLLGVAEVQRQAKKMSVGIECAREVARNAKFIIHQVYHVIAHNNLLEIADRLTRISGDGGAQFAVPEMEKATKVMQEAEAMVREKEKAGQPTRNAVQDPDAYKPVIAKTSEAYVEMEVVVQRVKHVAAGKIDEARKAIALAENSNAAQNALGDLVTAKQVLQNAEDQLVKGRLYDAARRAEDSKSVAVETNVKSASIGASKELDDARNKLKKANESGADKYAPVRFQDSLERMKTAENLYTTGMNQADKGKAAQTLNESRNVAVQAAEIAEQARMEPATNANEAIATARRFDAWKYDYNTVLQALIYARIAMEAIQANDYDRARIYSEMSVTLSKASTVYAKNAAFVDRVKTASDDLARASKDGAAFFMPDSVRRIAENLQRIKAGYTVDQFETISAEMNTCESGIKKIVETTPALFEDVEKKCKTKYDDLVKVDARDILPDEMRQADRALRASRASYDRKDYNTAYNEICRAIRTVNLVDSRLKEQIFIDQIGDMFKELEVTRHTIHTLMDFAPSTALATFRARARIGGRLTLAGSDTNLFRAEADRQFNQVRALEYPQTLKNTYNKLVECFRLTREASIQFEKFHTLDRFDMETASGIVQQAYNLMKKAKDIQNELQKQFEAKGLQGRLAKFDRK